MHGRWLGFVVLSLVGCQAGTNEGKLPTTVPAAFTAEQALLAPPPQLLANGEDCGAFGGNGCASGICVKTGGVLGVGYLCTSRCDGPASCPPGWDCTQLSPHVGGWMCLPAGPAYESSDAGAPQ